MNARIPTPVVADPDVVRALEAADIMLRVLPETCTNNHGTTPMMTTRGAQRLVRDALAKLQGGAQ